MIFFQNPQTLMYFPEMEEENLKKFFVLKIIAFEPGSTSSHILEQDTCHWQAICCETALRFKISLREVYSKPDSLRVMKNITEALS